MRKLSMKMPWTTILPVSLLVAVALGPSMARAEDETADRRALRRTAVVEVFEKCRDSVVFVTGPRVPAGDKAKLGEFFNVPIEKPEQSVGSGFVVHASGYVLTNAHGVDRVIAHEVVLADGKKYPAELIASLRNEDLALLKLHVGRPLSAVRLAPSGDLLIGETLIVIGNPHGLMSTCTTGTLTPFSSRKMRTRRGFGAY
jgi:serine protease Do